jgi:hypothetical protein
MTQNDINSLRSKIAQVHLAIERLYAEGLKDDTRLWAIENELEHRTALDLCDMHSVLTEWGAEFDLIFCTPIKNKES